MDGADNIVKAAITENSSEMGLLHIGSFSLHSNKSVIFILVQ